MLCNPPDNSHFHSDILISLSGDPARWASHSNAGGIAQRIRLCRQQEDHDEKGYRLDETDDHEIVGEPFAGFRQSIGA